MRTLHSLPAWPWRTAEEQEEEGKEKTQEFKIPVAAVLLPEGVLCAVPLCHAQYAIMGLA